MFDSQPFFVGSFRILTVFVCASISLPSFAQEASDEINTTTGQAAKAAEGDAFVVGVADQTEVGALPAFTKGLSYKAAVAFGKGDWKTARDAYKKIVAESPRNALVLTNLATVEQRLGELDSALAHLKTALEVNPKIAQAWVLQGLIHFQKGDSNLAVSSLTRALHEDPLDARAHNYLGVVTKEIGWVVGAEQELQRATELDPDYGDAHFNLALLYLEKRPPARELAKRHYQLALALGASPDKLVQDKIDGKKPE